MTPAPEIRLDLASNPAYLCAVREMVNLVSRRTGFPDAAAGKIALAVDEALANVMNHGYNRRTDGRIVMEIRRVENGAGLEGIRIVIEDEGRQVDPATIKSRDLSDIRPGGLGVHIIREVMDSVLYEKREGRVGMRLTMTKKINPGEVASSCGCEPRGDTCG